ncbi:ferredoxin-type protein NapF [Shewanella oneidensis MR-1]|uniref:Ferredoxin-type protein NapF n=1 Tax=Shewanella oneidensis (strain ATCC 700550 / JCM 31522 / CIP 106686 / LMG 19005 / NCIMB 14063 / MR-1) TaxID=211586 RepID=Q8EGE1_SHEON|nr:ferredoxin-type protein NapF [Shewanella oneidensis]AAN54718.1 nitrate reductase (NapA) maturase NapF [Shewanella oneidensis MR-1]MDX5996536.1 ferredoxin-type protein NapF [Shewanella oneidensis]MEE2027276.1 Ferredoxin-type protein NapF [Shewanella oneidensis]QKG96359.1 ferredoxin-type protein NapF [Shewanella oneidensis MR-1]
MTESINHSRRSLFNRRKSVVIRPPWVREEVEFTDVCTRCSACITACETKIIFKGDGGFPEISFKDNECTFCAQCATICPEEKLFDLSQTPWQHQAVIQDNCLTFQGIWCQSCKDACEPRAIGFTLSVGQAPMPKIDTSLCTGCGACVAPCPSQAISIKQPE